MITKRAEGTVLLCIQAKHRQRLHWQWSLKYNCQTLIVEMVLRQILGLTVIVDAIESLHKINALDNYSLI